MKLVSIELNGFRAFSRPARLDLDADSVLVLGPNGQGKTSLFDGVLWALTGAIPRFSSESSVLSMWSETGQARVALGLRGDDGAVANFIRTFDGERTTLAVEADGEMLHGPEAETRALRLLWPRALAAVDPQRALTSALERGAYLQQDLVTQFIAADGDTGRFEAISELVGAGRIADLQATLERGRNAWSRAVTTKTRERDELQDRAGSITHRLDQLTDASSAQTASTAGWNAWWARAIEVLGHGEAPTLGTSQGTAAVDAAVKELHALQLAQERTAQKARQAIAQHTSLPERPSESLAELTELVASKEQAVVALRGSLREAQERAAAVRRQQVELADQQASLRALAELALQHLGERCPVCDQKYQQDETRERLQEMVRTSSPASQAAGPGGVGELPALVERAERELSQATEALQAAQRRSDAWEASYKRVRAAIEELGITAAETSEQLSDLLTRAERAETSVTALAALRAEGETLALAAARTGEAARRSELEHELEDVSRRLAEVNADLAARVKTGDVVSQMIEGLREASAEVVAAQLSNIAPLIKRFFATADPHPAFRDAWLLSRFTRGKGRVVPAIADRATDKESQAPNEVLSSSQLNVLAVSVFLALNLGMPALPLQAAILDDPLQSLDDLNLLGLIDLLRQVRARRQLLLSTHDERFAQLLERKLRPVFPGQRTVVIEFRDWTTEGPKIGWRELERETKPLRMVA